jgi:predicted ATPase/DNA-binding SARP family transcriptional activator
MTQFRILGPLEVIDDGIPIDVGSPKERAVLTMLASNPGLVVSTDRLIEGLWGDEPPASALSTLRTYVSHLRSALSRTHDRTPIETAENGYRLVVDGRQVDAVRFAELIDRGDRAITQDLYSEASKAYLGALNLWRGPALAELPNDDRALIESHRLEELHLHALEGRFEADLKLGNHAALIPELEALVADHPFRERLVELLMTAMYRSGRQAEALRLYQEARKRLGDELGIEPGKSLKELEEAILLHEPDLDWPATPSRHNLPASLTSFIDREHETRLLVELLDAARLVTLTGTGGSGKTRLAIETAARLLDEYQGVWWIDFGSITDQDQVVRYAASVLLPADMSGAMNRASDPQQLIEIVTDHLGRRKVLVILDNCEHLLRTIASFTLQLVESAPNVGIIATSREPLQIAGEHLFRVAPLGFPSPDATDDEKKSSDAVELFVDRALAQDPGFSPVDLSGIAEICRRLDGIPLAIELAAGRLPVMSVHEISVHLGDRFSLLVGGARSGLTRHQTVRATIDWSYDGLSEHEKCFFRACSVYSGSFTLESSAAIAEGCGPALEALSGLIAKSLIHVERKHGSSRYRLLETLREYGRELLEETGNASEVFDAHARYFTGLAAQAETFLLTSQRLEWLDRLILESHNLQTALTWVTESHKPDLALSLVANLWRYWQARGELNEAAQRIDRVLALSGGDPIARAEALQAKGGVAYWQGRFEEADDAYREALRLQRDHGSNLTIARALYNAAFGAGPRGELDRAYGYTAESLALAVEAGSLLDQARAYWALGIGAWMQGELGDSNSHLSRALRLLEGLDAPYDRGWSNFMLAQMHYARGNLPTAREHLNAGLADFAQVEDQSALVLFLHLKASILFDEGDERTGGRLLGAARLLMHKSGVSLADAPFVQAETLQAVLRDPSPAATAAMAEGKDFTLREAISLAATA